MVINKNPVYDNDYVTLGYLKTYVESPNSELSKVYSKNFGTQPTPPYHVNDTWTSSDGKFYICIKDRFIGKFNISDWIVIIDKTPYDKLVADYGEVTIDMLVSQVYDHKIESFVQVDNPSTNWITYVDREQHVYDFWKNPSTNKEYIYIRKDTNPITYQWEPRSGSSIIWNGITGHKNIFNQKPESYNKSDLWLIGELTDVNDIPEDTEVGDWVVASQDSETYDKTHWSKAIIDIDLTITEKKVYSRVEVDNRITILENDFNVKLIKTENSILGEVSSNYATQQSVTTLDSNLGLVENRVTTTEKSVNLLEITSDRTVNTISSTNKTVLGVATYGVTSDTKFLEGVDYYILADGHYEMLAPGTDYKIGDNISDYKTIVYNATFQGGLQGTVTKQGEKVNELSRTVGELSSKISEIADITTSNETIFASVDLENVNESEPINIKIHPVGESISNLLIHSDMLISSTFKLKQRLLLFTNNKTGEKFPWYLPTDLWYYDEENWDELVLTYDPKVVTVNRKCQVNSYGVVNLLDTPKTETYEYPDLQLTEGDYTVSLVGYNNAYLFVRLLASNIYTTQFYTKAETNSLISQTTKNIYLGVDEKLTGYTTTEQARALINVSARDVLTQVSNTYTTKDDFGKKTTELSTRIKSAATSIELVATDNKTSAGLTIKLRNEDGTELSSQQANITLSGLVSFESLTEPGKTTINGANITTGTIAAERLDAKVITTENFDAQKINANNITSGTIKTELLEAKVITTDNISAQTISASNIKAGSINASSGVTIGGFTIGNYSLYGSTARGSMTIQRGTNASVDLPANGGRLMIGSTAANGVALTTASSLVISDNYSHTTTGDSNSSIAIRSIYGSIRLASNYSLKLAISGDFIIDGYTGQSIDRIIYKDSNGNNKYMIFHKGLLVGYN